MILKTIVILSLFFQTPTKYEDYDKNKQREQQYLSDILKNAHTEFILKFNRYLEKYGRGELAIKELREAIKSWEKLKNTEGFIKEKDGKSNP